MQPQLNYVHCIPPTAANVGTTQAVSKPTADTLHRTVRRLNASTLRLTRDMKHTKSALDFVRVLSTKLHERMLVLTTDAVSRDLRCSVSSLLVANECCACGGRRGTLL